MRLSLVLVAVACVSGCGNSDNGNDMGAGNDMSATVDMTGGGAADMTQIQPYNMPGKIFCYDTPACDTTTADKVCCDAKADGGFTDTCVASTGACLAIDSTATAYECGQAADCNGGQICCGATGMSKSGKKFFTATKCEASCASGETQLCVSKTECKTGTMCVGADISGRDVGLCM